MMMMIIKFILGATLTFTVIFFIFFIYYGGLKPVRMHVLKQGGEVIVCKEINGDYRQSGMVMDDVYTSLLHDYSIETYRGIGIYYDDPSTTPKAKLRSETGCVIEWQDTARIADIDIDLKIKTIPEKKYIVTEFPYLGKLSLLFSQHKVYPALKKYAEQCGYDLDGEVLEIYDMPGKRIIFRKAL